MNKIIAIIIGFILLNHYSMAQSLEVCGSDSIRISVSNFKSGTIHWEKSQNGKDWLVINGANDTTITFYPHQEEYYRAVSIFADCPPEFSNVTHIVLTPKANAGIDRVVQGSEVELNANLSNGTWRILSGINGSIKDTLSSTTTYYGEVGKHLLEWRVANACGVSIDTVSVEFIQNTYNSNIVIVDDSDIIKSTTQDLDANIYKIEFSAPIPSINDSTLLVGIIGDGFLKKVVSFTNNQGTFEMQTIDATLEDLVIDGVINSPYLLNVDTNTRKKTSNLEMGVVMQSKPKRSDFANAKFDINSYYIYKSEPEITSYIPSLEVNLDATNMSSFQIGISDTIFLVDTIINSNKIRVSLDSAYIRFVPNLVADYHIVAGQLKYLNVGLSNSKLIKKISLSSKVESELFNISKEIVLFSFSQNYLVVVGGVPVIFKANIDVKLLFDANLNAELQTHITYTETNNINMGIIYDDALSSYSEFENTVELDKGFDLRGDLTAGLKIGPELSIKLYGVVGPYVNAYATADFDLCIGAGTSGIGWNALLDINGEFQIGADATILGKQIFDVSKTFTKDIYELRLPEFIQVTSGNNQIIQTDGSIENPVVLRITSSTGFGVPLVPVQVFDDSDGSTSKNTYFSDINGNVAIDWNPGYLNRAELKLNSTNCYFLSLSGAPLSIFAIDSLNLCYNSSLDVRFIQTQDSIYALGVNGEAPYQYSLNGIDFSLSSIFWKFNRDSAFSVYVKDANGCIVHRGYKEISTDGLIAYYPFDGNTNDYSGNSNHAQNFGVRLVEDRNGNSASAAYFDGDSYLQCGNDPEFTPSGSVSFSVWFKISTLPTAINDDMAIIGKWQFQTGDVSYILNLDEQSGDKLQVVAHSGSVKSAYGSKIQAGVWYHYVGVIDVENNEIRIYLNDELVAQVSISLSTLSYSTQDLTIGRLNDIGNPNYLYGFLDEVRIYNRVLSESEIHELYTE